MSVSIIDLFRNKILVMLIKYVHGLAFWVDNYFDWH